MICLMACEAFSEWARKTGLSEVARQIGEYETARGRADKAVTYQAVQDWIAKGIPPRRVLCVEHLSNIPRHVLRPDIYPPEEGDAAA